MGIGISLNPFSSAIFIRYSNSFGFSIVNNPPGVSNFIPPFTSLNSKMQNVSLLAPTAVTTSVASYNLTYDFTKYQMLFLNLKYQGIYLNSIAVPSSLFSMLTSASACVQLQSGETTVQVYKNTNTSVYMASNAVTQNLRVEIIGFMGN